ncbi:MAG: ATP-binding protein [Pseudonocardiaceae bacterium]
MSTGGLPAQVGRHLRDPIDEALADTRVIGIVGPRQAGKSTLARSLVAARPNATYVSLDDRRVRLAAEADPHGFVAGRPGLLAVDEIQRVPDLLLAIKSVVDLDPRPGRFVITGSSQLSANRGVSETLAGRIERFELWPFSQGELNGRREGFLDLLLDDALGMGSASPLTKRDYLNWRLPAGTRRRCSGPAPGASAGSSRMLRLSWSAKRRVSPRRHAPASFPACSDSLRLGRPQCSTSRISLGMPACLNRETP